MAVNVHRFGCCGFQDITLVALWVQHLSTKQSSASPPAAATLGADLFDHLLSFFTIFLLLLSLAALFRPTCQPINIQQSHMSSASSDAQSGSSRTAGSASCVRENPRLLCPVWLTITTLDSYSYTRFRCMF